MKRKLTALENQLLYACKEALRRGSFAFNAQEDKERVEDLLEQANRCGRTP